MGDTYPNLKHEENEKHIWWDKGYDTKQMLKSEAENRGSKYIFIKQRLTPVPIAVIILVDITVPAWRVPIKIPLRILF